MRIITRLYKEFKENFKNEENDSTVNMLTLFSEGVKCQVKKTVKSVNFHRSESYCTIYSYSMYFAGRCLESTELKYKLINRFH